MPEKGAEDSGALLRPSAEDGRESVMSAALTAEDGGGHILRASLTGGEGFRFLLLARRLPAEDCGHEKQSAGARELVRLGAENVFGLPRSELTISVSPGGKPFFSNHRELHFSISHAGVYVMAVLSDLPVGVDIEPVRHKNMDSLARRIMKEDHYASWCLCPDRERAFFRYWVALEAYLKWTGEGLAGLSHENCGRGNYIRAALPEDGYEACVWTEAVPDLPSVCYLKETKLYE